MKSQAIFPFILFFTAGAIALVVVSLPPEWGQIVLWGVVLGAVGLFGWTQRPYVLRWSARYLWVAWLWRALPASLAVIPFGLFLYLGWGGVDFGMRHVDEPIMVEVVAETLERGVFIPDFYNYPSISYWLTLSALAPDARMLARGDTSVASLILADQYPFMLRARHIFLGVTALSALWMFGAGVAWRGSLTWESALEGLTAACLLTFSWEVGYHARFIAPDTVLMQFGALMLMCIGWVLTGWRHLLFMRLGALAVGLAIGTKYPGGLLLVPLLLTAVILIRRLNPSERRRESAKLMLIFLVSYLISTPGTLLAPLDFVEDVRYEIAHYGTIGHPNHEVNSRWEHLRLNLDFLGRALFSRYPTIAVFVSVMALVGAGSLAYERSYFALVLLSFPLLYVLFMSQQRVFFIRNLMIIAPFMALAAARGIFAIREVLRPRLLGWVWLAAPLIMILFNLQWALYARETILHAEDYPPMREFLSYLDDHPDTTFAASPYVWAQIQSLRPDPPSNIRADNWEEAEVGVVSNHEVWAMLPPHRVGTVNRAFGMQDVNYSTYPYWRGEVVLLIPRRHFDLLVRE